MGKLRKFISFSFAVLLVLSFSLTALAISVPDPDRKGSINITMHMGQETVGGGDLSVYRVGEVYQGDTGYFFRVTGDFVDCGLSLEDLTVENLAADFAKVAKNRQFTPIATKTIAADGTVSFTDLEIGLYLMVQNTAANGYNTAAPFLVSLPQWKDGEYSYEINASPKVELTKSDTPDPGPDPLPPTGQLQWPIPVMAILGMFLFAAGWILYRREEVAQ